MTLGTLLIGFTIFGAVVLALRSMLRNKKKGKSLQCGGDCGSCRGCH